MHKIYIHPLPVRIWHWTNAVGFVLMILTGMQIRYVGLIGRGCRSVLPSSRTTRSASS